MNSRLQFFVYEDDKVETQHITRPFGELARLLDNLLPQNDQKNAALDRLLEAQDAALRSQKQY